MQRIFTWIFGNKYKSAGFIVFFIFLLTVFFLTKERIPHNQPNVPVTFCGIEYNFNHQVKEFSALLIVNTRKESNYWDPFTEPKYLLIAPAKENFNYAGEFFMISKSQPGIKHPLTALGYWKGLGVFAFTDENNKATLIPKGTSNIVSPVILHSIDNTGTVREFPLKNNSIKKNKKFLKVIECFDNGLKSMANISFITRRNKVLAVKYTNSNYFIEPQKLLKILVERFMSFSWRLVKTKGLSLDTKGLSLDGLIEDRSANNIKITVFTPNGFHSGIIKKIEGESINNIKDLGKIIGKAKNIQKKNTISLELLENGKSISCSAVPLDRVIRKASFYNDFFSMDLFVNNSLRYYYDGKSKSILRESKVGDKTQLILCSSNGLWKKVLSEHGGAIILVSINGKKSLKIEDFLNIQQEAINNKEKIHVSFISSDPANNKNSFTKIKTVEILPFKKNICKKKKCCKNKNNKEGHAKSRIAVSK
jgi:hypothetical protein